LEFINTLSRFLYLVEPMPAQTDFTSTNFGVHRNVFSSPIFVSHHANAKPTDFGCTWKRAKISVYSCLRYHFRLFSSQTAYRCPIHKEDLLTHAILKK